MSTIGSLASTVFHAVLPINLFRGKASVSAPATIPAATAQQPDSGQLSSFAQLANTLQQLQQSNPTEYTQVTQKIAVNLQSAAQTAQSSGSPAVATQLNQLSTDFSSASATAQLPNLQDLAHAVGNHAHRHGLSSGSAVSQLLSHLQSASSQNSSFNAESIIQSTLTGAGIPTSNL